jgi:hypothetical protein
MPINLGVLAFPRLQPLNFPCSSTLTELVLAVESGYEYQPNRESWPKILCKFVLQFSYLETLELAFEPRLESQGFRNISRMLYLPRLRYSKLSTIDCVEDHLFHLFQTHRTTLEYICLYTINLNYDCGSWDSLLLKIRDQPKLIRLFITNNFVDDQDASIQKDDSALSFLEVGNF